MFQLLHRLNGKIFKLIIKLEVAMLNEH